MDIRQIFERVVLKSGQYLLARKNLEINIDAFRLLVEDSLSLYNKCSPHDVLINREIYYPRQYDFSQNTGPMPESVQGRIPDWVATANPMRYGGGSIGGILLREAQLNGQNELIDPILSPWRYDKPILTVSHSARYELRLVYDHIIEEGEPQGPDREKTFFIRTISTKDQALFDHIRAMFLQGVGHSRRAFTLNDLPILLDADQLIADGKELEDKAEQRMQNYQKFHLTYG